MTWYLYTVISIFSIAIGNLYQRIAMKEEESNPYAGSIIFQFVLTILTGIFALIKGFEFPPINLIGYFLISTLFYGFGTLSYFHALKHIEASESTILTSIGGMVTIISAYIFLGERLTLFQLLGFVFIIASVGIVSASNRGIRWNRGIIYAIVGTSLYGLAVTNDTFILRSYDAISYTPVISFLPGLLLVLLKPSSYKSVIETLNNKRIRPLFLYCFFYAVQAVTYYLALESGAMASQMAILFKTEIILTIILAAVFLHERSHLLRKFVATVLVLVGAYFLL
ncbi:MAG: hypothetical protein UX38_C0002G0024 [Microgenomates group bacterium GW2011_GWC1_46_16]|uniref:EamA domain-containing protein n=2 Tax=Candidatus Collieribacteriota TaxID=1752725 RepID=A0A1F5FXE7_9BACT|nr:MAG: hypothetical protein UX38_C0002G0024 [Microgenomates group bacterium GW2011_GWC1_46_16]KKU28260.1 MAG: hypothetical protein UX40_C0001G0023 [Microgenomates group bacterium GW2011_GWF2_46_18]KKU45268.1 MAG: hypothetical protein UX63_C0009G0032 [Microgenomates group bacterium GW2011_GWB1_46_7]KKU62077.1 MAG: hypothetical protein UX82_C0001G0003 [Microgenomates group bacterium GW2011_GWE1_47_12]KKU62710.1 MAG: hypothetical protein UX84_C0003G0068 [Microgenomates group bacterium GW2011_GWD1